MTIWARASIGKVGALGADKGRPCLAQK